ncbi:MAG: hypothetical protein LUD46_21395, partial [Parabacteroides sp.]|nr:hypothetical protein [Parabacteroides sp.]
ISSYNDILFKDKTENDISKMVIEPTITQRVILFLKSIYAENGLLNMLSRLEEEQYLKEFTIHYPTVEQAEKVDKGASRNSRNSISLSMLAQNYCLKEKSNSSDEYERGDHIIVTLESCTAKEKGLKISPFAHVDTWDRLPYGGDGKVVEGNDNDSGTKIHLKGRSSNIFLVYPEDNQLESGDEAIITVTNEVGHRIAKYTIKFEENTQGLTETALKEIEEMMEEKSESEDIIEGKCQEIQNLFSDLGNSDKMDLLEKLYTRTDKYMKETYGEPYIQLDWNYEQVQPNKGEGGGNQHKTVNYYPYPMNWDYSTYAFNDGVKMILLLP